MLRIEKKIISGRFLFYVDWLSWEKRFAFSMRRFLYEMFFLMLEKKCSWKSYEILILNYFLLIGSRLKKWFIEITNKVILVINYFYVKRYVAEIDFNISCPETFFFKLLNCELYPYLHRHSAFPAFFSQHLFWIFPEHYSDNRYYLPEVRCYSGYVYHSRRHVVMDETSKLTTICNRTKGLKKSNILINMS